ncbi:PhzF family phenazine biosynthesis protein [Metaclostridioides mangenotii]|uniref:PhzF family phenazine biosynthesis protein n=1 Tax=Metaclostridioides mangenotii TaxID=1540 RepID=UPI000483FB5E|nr:PhzF family phenazine biosynthesis isomerase [Clostridioides mangenotii]
MKYYVVDSFTNELFKGNPAGICVVEKYPSAEVMQKIAAENCLSETAFVCKREDGDYDIRYSTPMVEVDLCGHATLGTSYVLANLPT